MAAAVGVGTYPDFGGAIKAMVHMKNTTQPGPNQKIYKKLYKKILKVSEKLKEIKSDIAF
jgi:ribulose kinase